eukprot:Gb_28372 [translate_table: standard]
MSTFIVDLVDDEGNTPLDMASAQNNLEIFTMLLVRSKRPLKYFYKMDIGNVLCQSTRNLYFDFVNLQLLENGANPLDSDGDGKTILHYATNCDKEDESLDFFLRYARNIELTKVVDKNGRTILHIATFRAHAKLCDKLLSNNSGLYMCKDRDGQTPLHNVVKQNIEAAVNTLLKKFLETEKYEVDFRDLSGTMPLHIAAAQGNLTLVKILLSYLLQKYVRISDFLGEVALHKAARIGHCACGSALGGLGGELKPAPAHSMRGAPRVRRLGGQGVKGREPSSVLGLTVSEETLTINVFENEAAHGGPSLRKIVDLCMEEQRAKKVKSDKGDTILKKVRAKEEEKEMMVIEEKDMKATEEAKIKVLGKQKEGKSKDYEKCKRKIIKVAHEEELEWEKLSQTLRRYNVSMEGMQAF